MPIVEAGHVAALRLFDVANAIDLTRAEAVLGVIDATSPAQLDAALRQLAGGLAAPVGRLRDHAGVGRRQRIGRALTGRDVLGVDVALREQMHAGRGA